MTYYKIIYYIKYIIYRRFFQPLIATFFQLLIFYYFSFLFFITPSFFHLFLLCPLP